MAGEIKMKLATVLLAILFATNVFAQGTTSIMGAVGDVEPTFLARS
jgi:hypothetical protein